MKTLKNIGIFLIAILFFLSACSEKENTVAELPSIENTIPIEETETIDLNEPTTPSPTILISPSNEPTSTTETLKKLSGKRIGLDPGHQATGNKDQEPVAPNSSTMKNKVSSGTQGRFSKTNEYEITLSIAQKLKEKLEAEGVTVIMTRTSNDVDISNRERAILLNEASVDIAIRLHADGNDDPSIHGVSVLVPSGDTTTSIQEKSQLLGEIILQAFERETNAKNRGVIPRSDQTGFNWSTVPVCNVEMGFLSNESEDQLFNTEKYQNQCAQGIFHGIVQYYESIGQ